MNPQEQAQQKSLSAAQVMSGDRRRASTSWRRSLHAIPEFQTGAAGGFSSPFVTLQLGGQMIGDIASAFATSIEKIDLASTRPKRSRRRPGRIPAPPRRMAARAGAADQGEGAARQAHRRNAAQTRDPERRTAAPRARSGELAQGAGLLPRQVHQRAALRLDARTALDACTSRPTRWRSTRRNRQNVRSASSAATRRRRSSSSRTGTA